MSSSLHQTKDSTRCLACSTTQQPPLTFVPDKSVQMLPQINAPCTKLEVPELQFMEQSEALPTYLSGDAKRAAYARGLALSP